MTILTHAEWQERDNCRRRLLIALRDEMKHRHDDDQWESRERIAITSAANQWAIAHNRSLISVADVEAIEHRAMGHFDYTSKLALYVAELVYR